MNQIVRIDLVDEDQMPVLAELRIGPKMVEVRCREELFGVSDRKALRSFLSDPKATDGVFKCEGICWLWNGWDIGLCIRDVVPACFLRPHVVEHLRLYL